MSRGGQTGTPLGRERAVDDRGAPEVIRCVHGREAGPGPGEVRGGPGRVRGGPEGGSALWAPPTPAGARRSGLAGGRQATASYACTK